MHFHREFQIKVPILPTCLTRKLSNLSKLDCEKHPYFHLV